MKSVKPGRAPSFMGGIMSIAIGIFGVIWTIMAASMGGGLFAAFGIVFIIVAIIQAVYNFKNATSENRYSAFDITDGSEEQDPLNEYFGESRGNAESNSNSNSESRSTGEFCPYCGTKVLDEFEYCNKCGKKLP